MTGMLRISLARDTEEHLQAVLGLMDEARNWLAFKVADQWARPWPNRQVRDARVLRGQMPGATWIVWDGSRAAATVAVTGTPNPAVWTPVEHDLSERAVYVHRLIVARDYSGWGLGAELVDWTGLRGRRLYGARWIRIDVWSSNTALHDYYVKRGFERCGTCRDPCYPSGALFQKPVSKIAEPAAPLFSVADEGKLGTVPPPHRGAD